MKAIYILLHTIDKFNKEYGAEGWHWVLLIAAGLVLIAIISGIALIIGKHIFDQDYDEYKKTFWVTAAICVPFAIGGILSIDDNYKKEKAKQNSYLSIEEIRGKKVNPNSTDREQASTAEKYNSTQSYSSYGSSYYDNSYNNINTTPVYESQKTWHSCSRCNGSGRCNTCNGEGEVYDWGPLSAAYKEKYIQRCPVCNGRRVCGVCDGVGGAEY